MVEGGDRVGENERIGVVEENRQGDWIGGSYGYTERLSGWVELCGAEATNSNRVLASEMAIAVTDDVLEPNAVFLRSFVESERV